MSPTTIKHNKFTRLIFKPVRLIIKNFFPNFYVKLEYKYITGHHLHLNNPIRYTEKLQYLRLKTYKDDSLVSQCASRSSVREYLKSLGFNDYLINIYGVFNKFEDIDFSLLPNQFVMKCTHACAFNYICFDKDKINYKSLEKRFKKWLNTNYGKIKVEPHYSNIKPQIIIEELILENNKLPIEYKIHVFNGQAKYMYIVTDRNNGIHYNNYYIDWKEFDGAQFNHWTKSENKINKPDNWDEMVNFAEKISQPFPFVRVDLYNVNNKIYFSEMTFTPAKGTLTFKDDKVDFEIGSWLNLKTK